MSYDTHKSTSHSICDFTALFCKIDDFFQRNAAVYWQYLKQENPKVRGKKLDTWKAFNIYMKQ
jgi:hypothetical protein